YAEFVQHYGQAASFIDEFDHQLVGHRGFRDDDNAGEYLASSARLAKERRRGATSADGVDGLLVFDDLRVSAFDKGLFQPVDSFIEFHRNNLGAWDHTLPYQHRLEFRSVSDDAVFHLRIARRREKVMMAEAGQGRSRGGVGQAKHT